MTIPTLTDFGALRPLDMVARISGVRLFDAARVLIAYELVSWYFDFDTGIDDFFCANRRETIYRPSSENAVACNDATDALISDVRGDPEMLSWYNVLQNFRN